MGAPDYSDLYSIEQLRLKTVMLLQMRLMISKQMIILILFAVLQNNPNTPEGTFNNYFADDSYQINIEIPNFIEAEPFTLDAEPLIIDGRPKFDTGALSRERQRHMGAMLEAIRGVGKE